MQVNFQQTKQEIIECFKEKLVPFVHSSPGIGKSALMAEIAEEYNLELIDIRLSQFDVCDLNGFPQINGDSARYVPMDIFPLENTPLPAGKNGFLIFLDEFSSAPLLVQAGAYKLILDRSVGNKPLHSHAVMALAGNLSTDNAIVNRISTAMQSRVIHYEMVSDKAAWLSWAAGSGLDHRICSFIEFRPDLLNKFDPNHNDYTFPCERTWEFASKVIRNFDPIPERKIATLAGTISEGAAREFYSFSQIYKDLPDIKEILANPEEIDMPDEPSMRYALTGCVGNNATMKNVATLMKFVNRLPAEFQVITLRSMVKRNKELLGSKPIKHWFSTTGQELI